MKIVTASRTRARAGGDLKKGGTLGTKILVNFFAILLLQVFYDVFCVFEKKKR